MTIEHIADKHHVSEDQLDFLEVIDEESVLDAESIWQAYEQWLDAKIPKPAEFFTSFGNPTDGAVTMDIVPVPDRPLAVKVALLLGRKGFLRARGPYFGRREGGYYFEPVEPEWFEVQERLGWPDQKLPFEKRKKLVASTYLVNQLLWLNSIRTINEHGSDFYAHISPEVFDHRSFDGRTSYESLASRYRATLPTLALPNDLEKIPFDVVLGLRAELGVARLAFRNEIENLIKLNAAASDENSLTRLQGLMLEIARQRYEDSKKTFAAARLKATLKAVGLSVAPPAAMACVASMLNIGLFVPAAIVAAVAFGAAEILSLRDMAGVEERKSPWAYLTTVASQAQTSAWRWSWSDPDVELFEDESFRERYHGNPDDAWIAPARRSEAEP